MFVFLVYCLFDFLVFTFCVVYLPRGNVVALIMFAGGRVSGFRVVRVWIRNTLAVVTEDLVVLVQLIVSTLIALVFVVTAYSCSHVDTRDHVIILLLLVNICNTPRLI